MNVGNPCFRCGKQRIVVSTKRERVGGSWVTTTQTTCPDPECQAKVDMQMEKERNARASLLSLDREKTNSFGRKKKDISLKSDKVSKA